MFVDQNQKVWKLPAALNLTLGGMGAGFYLLALLAPAPQGASWTETLALTAALRLVGPLLAAVGLLSLTTEAGRPLNSIYLLGNLRHSWMSRETLAALVFILCAGLDWLFPHPALSGVAAVAAFMFMLAQGMMVWRAGGVYTWEAPVVPWFFLTCGLSTGGGLLLALNAFFAWTGSALLPTVVLIVAAANAAAWLVYLNTPGELFQRGLAPIRRTSHVALTLGVGHLLPIALILFVMVASSPPATAAAGLGLVFGGFMQKFAFSFQAGLMRSVVRV